MGSDLGSDLYCCLLPLYKALHTCCSGFPIATKWCCDQDVEVVPSSAITQRMCDRCGSLLKGGDVVATSQWCCVKCVIHHEQDVCEEEHQTYVVRTSNNRVIMACELHCCLLPQCEALRTFCSGFPIATVLIYALVWLCAGAKTICHLELLLNTLYN